MRFGALIEDCALARSPSSSFELQGSLANWTLLGRRPVRNGGFIPHKSKNIRLLIDELGDWLAAPVAGFRIDSNQNWFIATLRGLQRRSEFE